MELHLSVRFRYTFFSFFRIEYKTKLEGWQVVAKTRKAWKKKFDFHQSMATKRADLEGMKKELACAEFQECQENIT